MRVLLYTHTFAPNVGGVETYVLLLARGLAARARVTLATATPAGGFDDSALPFPVVRQPSARALWRLARQADVVQLAGPALVPLAIALLARRPVVIEHHGYQAVCPNGLLFYRPLTEVCPGHFRGLRWDRCLRCNAQEGWPASARKLVLTVVRRWLAARVAANVGVSEHVGRRVELPRTTTIRHGIEDPLAGTEPGDAPPAEPCFAYVGRLVAEKGLPLLLEAARALKDKGYRFQLRFVGDGDERARLEGMARRLGLEPEVRFLGQLQGEALGRAVADAAAVVMPSRWEETAGLAAVEQMMRGRAVVAANLGGLAEYVDGAGLLFTPGDAASLADCLRRILDEPGLVREIGRAARARAMQEFHVARMVEDHLKLYERVMRVGA